MMRFGCRIFATACLTLLVRKADATAVWLNAEMTKACIDLALP